MDSTTYFKEQFDELQMNDKGLSSVRLEAFDAFNRMGIPTTRDEDWKYTRIGNLFNKEYRIGKGEPSPILPTEIAALGLPGYGEANIIVFINGVYSQTLSCIRSKGFILMPLNEALQGEYKTIVDSYYNHSRDYIKDGINALNTALATGSIFVHVQEKTKECRLHIYNIIDNSPEPVLLQPRSLIYIDKQAELQITETYYSKGENESITNEVMEIVMARDAILDYYKIQNDSSNAGQISTTHIRQIEKGVINAVTVSLNGSIVRNNLHAILEASLGEAHLYGLYFPQGQSHIDNHSIVDNVAPGCLSNELYKGILNGQSAGVFNGKIFVRKDAQKTNAFQSNKNILLSDNASINSKPQLEIFADDVKCSHGCTVGSLDEESLFYLQSRGISKKEAISLLLQGFAQDIIEKIKPLPLRNYINQLIIERLRMEAL